MRNFNVSEILVDAGISKKELADLVGRSERTISNWINDPDSIPSTAFSVLRKLSEGETENLRNISPIPLHILFDSSNKYDNLLKLAELLERGLLTRDEFEAEKRKLLA